VKQKFITCVGIAEKVFKVSGSKIKSDGHENAENSVAAEPLKEFKQELTQIHVLTVCNQPGYEIG